MKEFVHLHCHSEYSLLDGANQVVPMSRTAEKDGQTAMALTDHGNMYGALSFYNACKDASIKPVIGCEFYVAKDSRRKRHSKVNKYNHLTLLAKNDVGYRNLLYLTSVSFIEGMSVRPRIDLELLSARTEGIICLSGCLSGPVNDLILQDKMDEALAKASELRDLFGKENFWLELQRNGLTIQEKANVGIVKISKQLSAPIVATNDIHYLRHEDCDFQDSLLCVATGSRKDDEDRFRFDTDQVYLKTQKEMEYIFKDMPDTLKATKTIEEMIDLDITQGEFVFPEYSCQEDSPELELKKIVEGGITKLYGVQNTKAKERAASELEVINGMGYPEYFLIVRDIIEEAKRRDIPVGPGRGSAAGSIVAYACGITDVDPLRYNLLFERFLTYDRVGLPDIDVDFCKEGRSRVIDFMRERYGEDRVANIITFGRFGSKSAVRQTARILDVPLHSADEIAKKVPEGLSIEETINKDSTFRDSLNKWDGLEETAKQMEGFVSHAGVHASGVVVGDRPLYELVPIGRNNLGVIVTQWDGDDCERIGLVKFDILGLSTLTVIERCQQLIEERHGHRLNLEKAIYKDTEIYKVFSEGDTEGIFQCYSDGIKKLLIEMKAANILDIAAALALFRPGPLESKIVDHYLLRRSGKEDITYVHPCMKKYMKDTYGLMIYQEQIMQMATELAGLTPRDADRFRKGVGKKDLEVLNKLESEWLNGCEKAKKINRAKASSIWEEIKKFARYGFNKSHAVCYSVISLKTAFLKHYYPVEFFSANLTEEANGGTTDKLKAFIHDAKNHGIKILPPDIRNWSWTFLPESDTSIRMGVGGIKNIGVEPAEKINNTQFSDSIDIFQIISEMPEGTVRKDILESAAKAGALDFTGIDRGCLMEMIPRLIKTIGRAKAKQKVKSKSMPLFGVEEDIVIPSVDLDETIIWTKAEKLSAERSVYDFYLSDHPMADKRLDAHMAGARTISSALSIGATKEIIKIAAVISSKEVKSIKNGKNAGKKYARLLVEDSKHQATAMLFSKKYEEHWEKILEYFEAAEPVIISGRLDHEASDLQIIVQDVRPLAGARARNTELVLDLENIGNTTGYEEIAKIFNENTGDTLVSFKLDRSNDSPLLMRLKNGIDIYNKQVRKAINKLL